MNVRVLGCHGGEVKGCRTTCFLIDGRMTIDAGSMCEALTLEELVAIDDVVLTHSHWDHVRDVPLLTDLLVGERKTAVNIHGPGETVRAMGADIFNNRTWPDFREIPTKENPVIRLLTIEPYQPFAVQGFKMKAVPVHHPVASVGYIIEKGGHAIAFSGDTGPTVEFWQHVNQTQNVKAVFVELSFPNKLQWLADLSGHLTPQSLVTELDKLDRRGAEIYLYHLKPAFLAELKAEVKALKRDYLHVCELDESYTF
jgi:ribonuclease BN (tRNA processing enzyme)